MKLNKLWIERFKNLQDFHIDFDQESLITVIVGWNGAGKSNLIEALVLIFRDLELWQYKKTGGKGKASFNYKLDYIAKGDIKIQVEASQGSYPVFTVNGKKKNREKAALYIPKQVFGYYSGSSDRLAKHFEEHQKRFREQLIYPHKHGLKNDDVPERPLFYAQNIHSLFVLLAFFFKEEEVIKTFLKDELRIEGLESILFVIHEPYWKQDKHDGKGNPNFWNAKGVAGSVLGKLYDIALAPIRTKRSVPIALGQNKTKEFVYLYIKSLEDFRQLADQYDSAGDLFKALESIHFSDFVSEDSVKIKVKIRNMDGSLTFKELSEGEQQLLMVLGLLRFTREEESLFFLDEPDTHLNPSWSVKYLDLLRHIVGVDNQDSSHLIISSHDPVLWASLEPQQLQIMERAKEGSIIVRTPEQGPRGLGFSGILTTIMGLASELDSYSLELLKKKKELEIKEPKTKDDIRELQKLDKEIQELGFQNEFRDPDYGRYLKAWRRAGQDFANEIKDSDEDQAVKEAKALEIVKKLLGVDI